MSAGGGNNGSTKARVLVWQCIYWWCPWGVLSKEMRYDSNDLFPLGHRSHPCLSRFMVGFSYTVLEQNCYSSVSKHNRQFVFIPCNFISLRFEIAHKGGAKNIQTSQERAFSVLLYHHLPLRYSKFPDFSARFSQNTGWLKFVSRLQWGHGNFTCISFCNPASEGFSCSSDIDRLFEWLVASQPGDWCLQICFAVAVRFLSLFPRTISRTSTADRSRYRQTSFGSHGGNVYLQTNVCRHGYLLHVCH